jgi:hypothetical protein
MTVTSGRDDTKVTLKEAETPPINASTKDAEEITGKLSNRTVTRSLPASENKDGVTLPIDASTF